MVKKLMVICAALSASLYATPVTLIDSTAFWQYSVLSTDLQPGWSSVVYTTVNWASIAWSDGQAAFSEEITSDPTRRHTVWNRNTDLALQKTVTIDGTLNGDLTLNLALDNGAIVFVNGQEVFRDNQEFSTSYWEYSRSISSSYFHSGNNIVQVLAEDHGGTIYGNNYFDMKLTGDVSAAVPEPSSISIVLFGVVGLLSGAAFRRRK